MNKPSKELLTYAFIAQGFSGAGSALDGVSNLLAHLVGRLDGKPFQPEEIVRLAKESLGLELTPLVVESLVPSLLQLGCLELVAEGGGHAAYKCRALDASVYQISEEQINKILEQFRVFAAPQLEEHGLSCSESGIDQALLEFLTTADFLSSWLQPDKSEFRGRVLTLKKDDLTQDESRLGKALDTLCALFVQKAYESDADLFSKLVAASWGAVVLEVVTTLQVGAARASGALNDLSIFVDTPILLDLLDLGDEDQHKYAVDLFELMRRSGAKIATFSHVVEEMRTAVETTLGRFARGEPFSGPMAKRLRADSNYSLSARLALAQLEGRLQENDVEIVPDVNFESADLVPFFPEGEVDSLRSRVGEIHRNVERRDRDAKSIAFVIRSRRGSTVSPVSLSKFVFVTRNVPLCEISKKYAEMSGFIPRHSAPPAVTDRQLAGVLWFCVGAPASEGASLTRSKIIANCASAVAPRLDVVSRMGQVLFDKDPRRLLEYEALIRDQRAAMCVTRHTLNVVSLVDLDQAEKLLDDMRRSLTEDAAREFEREKQALTCEFETALQSEREQRMGAERSIAQRDATIEETQKIVSDLRETHGRKIAEVGEELGAMRDQVNVLSSRSEKAYRAVSDALVDRVTLIAKVLTVVLALAYSGIGWIVQQLTSIPALGIPVGLAYSALGYWVLPEVLLHPLLRKILYSEAVKGAARISGASGIEIDCDEVVRDALDRLQSWGRGKSIRQR